MIRLYAYVGELSEDELDFLIDNLEEEWSDDRDYYINKPMLDGLRANGADSRLLNLLAQAIGDKDEVDILWVDTDEMEYEEEEEDGA